MTTSPIAPYVIPYTGEVMPPTTIVVGPYGVSYEDAEQDAAQRDIDGVLWEPRIGSCSGLPAYAADLHPERQRDAMENHWCSVCRGPADRTPEGMLWLLPLPDDGMPDTGWEGLPTAVPPVCTVDADRAPKLCPRLRDGHVLLRVKEAELIGVRGTLHPRPGEPGLPAEDALVLFDSPDLPFVVARQVVRELGRCTVVHFAAAAL